MLEFGELRGLKVTFAQACRLWHADEAKCLAALEALVDEGFLRRSASGAFIALPKPQRKAVKATLADSADYALPSLPPPQRRQRRAQARRTDAARDVSMRRVLADRHGGE